jgi:uncharacterized protein
MPGWYRWDAADLVLTLRVQPRAARDALVPAETRLRVRITAAPVDGAANSHLLKYLAQEFGVASSSVRLLRGTRSRDKVVRIVLPRLLPATLAAVLRRPADG